MSVLNQLISGINSINEHADPRSHNYFLVDSSLYIIAILILYVGFVFKIGPIMMKNRQPMQIDKIIMVYNWVQIISNAAILIQALQVLPKMSVYCSPLDKSHTPHALLMVDLTHKYFMLKLFDLLDTIFFVLRKKYSQVTFLHVYHHLLMVSCTWLACKFFNGGQPYFMGLVNLFVHVVMYFYYFLTAWNPKYRENIWWKKYITQLQIAQHCFVFVTFAIPFFNPECTYPKFILGAYLTQTVTMIYLFVNFYIKAYVKTKPKTE